MTKSADGAEKLRISIYDGIGQIRTMLGMLELGVQLVRSEIKENSDESLDLNSRVQEFVKILRDTADRLT